MKLIERIRNYWRRWGLHKAQADAQMWKEIADEEREIALSCKAAGLRGIAAAESYELGTNAYWPRQAHRDRRQGRRSVSAFDEVRASLARIKAEGEEIVAERDALLSALYELQNGPDTLTQDGLRIVNKALLVAALQAIEEKETDPR